MENFEGSYNLSNPENCGFSIRPDYDPRIDPNIIREFSEFVARNRRELSHEDVIKYCAIEIEGPEEEARPGFVLPKYIKKGFEHVAPHWSSVQTRELYLTNFMILLKHVPFKSNDTILSIGSGPGLHEIFLAKYIVPNGKVICMDIAHNMNLEAQKIAQKENVDNIEFVTGEGGRLPFANNSVDHVIALNSINWMSNWREATREIKKVVKNSNGSRLVYSMGTNTIAAEDINPQNLTLQLNQNGTELLEGYIALTPSQSRKKEDMTLVIVAKP